MKTLVTGANGFIGSHLVEELLSQKRKVKCLVEPNSNLSILKNLDVEIVYGNLLDKKSLVKAVKDVDIVYHLAAIARPMAIPNKEYFKINVKGTKNLLEACLNKKIKKIIHMSSISAVGPSRNNKPVNEKTTPKPVDTYGFSKLEAEKIVFDYIKKYKLPILLLRPPMVFGPRDLEMLRLFKAISKGFFPIRSNKGHLEFCYVENLIEACLLAEEKGKIGQIYHISNEKSYTINEVVNTMAEEMNVKLKPIIIPNFLISLVGLFLETLGKIFNFHPPFKRDTSTWMTTNYWYSDISKAKKELNYKPKISLREGIKRTVKWYKINGYL